MKILFCINSLVKGGAERVVSNLANYFSNDNDVSIMTLTNYEIAYELRENINIINLDKKKKKSYENQNKLLKKIVKIPKLLYRVIKMRKELKKISADIIISFLPETSFLVLLNKRKSDKIIVSVRNDPKIEYKSRIYNLIMKKLYPRANGFIFQTYEAQEYFKDIIRCESTIIPNPINPMFISKSYEGERKQEIVSVGRLTNQKNFTVLINAFAEISQKYTDYKLIIYGEGELRNELEKEINDLKLNDRILLPGITNMVKEKIYQSRMFVLPSLYEGMPNSLMEAMALGMPVISTDCPCGGPRELIKNNINGLLIEVNNKEELVKAMEKIILNEELMINLGKEASKISETHNPDEINKKWRKYIEKVSG